MKRYNLIVTLGVARRAASEDEAKKTVVEDLRSLLHGALPAEISTVHAESLPYGGMNKDQPWFDEADKADFVFKTEPFAKVCSFPDMPGVWFWTDGVAILRGVGPQPSWPIVENPTTYDRIVGNEVSTKRAPTTWKRCTLPDRGFGMRSIRTPAHGINALYFDLITNSWPGLSWHVPTKEPRRAAIAVSDVGDIIAAVMPMIDAPQWRDLQ